MSELAIQKVYNIKTVGTSEAIDSFEKINKLFIEMKKNKVALGDLSVSSSGQLLDKQLKDLTGNAAGMGQVGSKAFGDIAQSMEKMNGKVMESIAGFTKFNQAMSNFASSNGNGALIDLINNTKNAEVGTRIYASTLEKTAAITAKYNGHSKELIGNLILVEQAEKIAAQTEQIRAKNTENADKKAIAAQKAQEKEDAAIIRALEKEDAAYAKKIAAAKDAVDKLELIKQQQLKSLEIAGAKEAVALQKFVASEEKKAIAVQVAAEKQAKAVQAAEEKKAAAAKKYADAVAKELAKVEAARDKEQAKLDKANESYNILLAKSNEAAHIALNMGARQELLLREVSAGNNVQVNNTELDRLAPALKAAQTEAKGLSDALLKVEQAVGRSQRNVGNYNSAVFAMSQVLREAPAFAYSFSTGLMAISNNIPPLVDEITRLKAVNKDLIEGGGKAIPIWKTLAGAFTSPIGIITILTAAITILSARMTMSNNTTDKAAVALKKYNDQLKTISENAAANVAKDQANSMVLMHTAKNIELSMKTRVDAIDSLRKANVGLFDDYTNEIFLTGKTADAEERLTKAIYAKYAAQAYGEKSAAAMKKKFDITEGTFDKDGNDVLSPLAQAALNVEKAKKDLATGGGIDQQTTSHLILKLQDAKDEYKQIQKELAKAQKEIDKYNKKQQEAFGEAEGLKSRSQIENLQKLKADLQNLYSQRELIPIGNTADLKAKMAEIKKLEDLIKSIEGKGAKGANTVAAGINDLFEARKRADIARAEAAKQQFELQAANNKAIYEDDKNTLQDRLDAYNAFQQARIMIATIDSAKDVAIAQDKLNSLLEKEKQYNAGKIKLSKNALAALRLDEDTTTKELTTKKEHLNSELANIHAQGILGTTAITKSDREKQKREEREYITSEQSGLQDRLSDFQDIYNKEATVIAKSYLNKEISEREFQKRLKKLKNEFDITLLNEKIAQDEFSLNDDKITDAKEIEQIKSRLTAEKKALTDAHIEKVELERKANQVTEIYKQGAFELAAQAEQSYFQMLQRRLDLMDQAEQRALAFNKKQSDSQVQSNQQKIASDRAYDLAQQQLEKDKMARQKELAKQQMAIDYALAVMKIWSVRAVDIPVAIAETAVVTGVYGAKLAMMDQYGEGGDVPNGGGMFGGRSHSNGGTPFSFGGRMSLAEAGELAIINKRSSGSNQVLNISGTPKQIASGINAWGGGRNFAPGAMMSYGYPGSQGSQLHAPAFITNQQIARVDEMQQARANSAKADQTHAMILNLAGTVNELAGAVSRQSSMPVVLNPNAVTDFQHKHSKSVNVDNF